MDYTLLDTIMFPVLPIVIAVTVTTVIVVRELRKPSAQDAEWFEDSRDWFTAILLWLIWGMFGLIFWQVSLAVYGGMTSTTVCRAEAKVVGLEQAAGTRRMVHTMYMLDNGQRYESDRLLQNGETVCTDSETVRK